VRAVIASGSDHKNPLLAGNLQRLGDCRIARPSEAHVDDPGAALDRVIESLDDVHRARFRLAGAAEGADCDDVRLRGDAVKEAAALPPKLTAVAPEKLVPVMVTLVPPDVGPVFGLTLVTVGFLDCA